MISYICPVRIVIHGLVFDYQLKITKELLTTISWSLDITLTFSIENNMSVGDMGHRVLIVDREKIIIQQITDKNSLYIICASIGLFRCLTMKSSVDIRLD